MAIETEQIRAQVVRLQVLTLVWMAAEAVIALAAAWRARSPALLGFGGDSAVELLSAAVVLWRFSARRKRRPAEKTGRGEAGDVKPPLQEAEEEAGRERWAAKIAGGLLFVLAAFVVLAALRALLGHAEPRQSCLGIVLLLLAAMFMPWLAAQKLRLAVVTGSAALKADAAESKVCGYLAVIALVGLVVNAAWSLPWADAVAGLGLLPIIVREGWEAVEKKKEVMKQRS